MKRTAEEPDLEPVPPVADVDAPELVVDAPELVVETARPFPIVLVGTQDDVAGAGCASGVGFWPWKKVEVP